MHANNVTRNYRQGLGSEAAGFGAGLSGIDRGSRGVGGQTDTRRPLPRVAVGCRSCKGTTLHASAWPGLFWRVVSAGTPGRGRGRRSGCQTVGTASLTQPWRPQTDAKAERYFHTMRWQWAGAGGHGPLDRAQRGAAAAAPSAVRPCGPFWGWLRGARA
jgi:hypothetical protein